LTSSGVPPVAASSARKSGLFHRFPMTQTLPPGTSTSWSRCLSTAKESATQDPSQPRTFGMIILNAPEGGPKTRVTAAERRSHGRANAPMMRAGGGSK
jgi:hypothetical protein